MQTKTEFSEKSLQKTKLAADVSFQSECSRNTPSTSEHISPHTFAQSQMDQIPAYKRAEASLFALKYGRDNLFL